ncbi:ROK family protein [Oceanobacillus iheyensis]|uniref:Transcriptional repressor of the xylose operon n=1 Tax=Oceanobacillus iheyensis (strain DSM 14371 / CIP 107618 / JCM 11309 / KCTC 3954 / HTE831) TaxID=221109 RepID=Q8ELU2_OCEIH|nr:ROK family protein [Oceanobacillus iheyensis]BAC15080.1 transcriptional repressor of the xylose operon [Oceanobacillus iheyensis HTE831]
MKINRTWNQYVVKQENKSLVFNTIRQNSPISRADIAQQLGLNKSTVSSLVSELINEELIGEVGPGESSGGRRPVMLFFNNTAGYSIGIDLGVNYILGVLTDLQGNILEQEQVTFDNLTYEEILVHLNEVIQKLITMTSKSPYGVIGIGVAVPGIVNKEEKILLAPNLNWRNISLKEELENQFNIPVIIENEANAGAYGEVQFGIGKENKEIVYVSVGVGIGVGLVLNNQLYKGNNGFSGEMGHMTIDAHGAKCSCGSEGCWELYASEKALLQLAKRNKIYTTDPYDLLDHMIQLAKNNDSVALEAFNEISKYLAIGINNIINSFNPEQVIIGNRMSAAKKWIEKPLLDSINNQSLWFSQKDLKIDFSSLNTHSNALGMAAFSSERFLKVTISGNEVIRVK